MAEIKGKDDIVIITEEKSLYNIAAESSKLTPMLQKKIPSFEHFSIKNYFLALYQSVIQDENIRVIDFNVLESHTTPYIAKPSISRYDENGRAILNNDFIYVKAYYKGAVYQMTLYITGEQGGGIVPIHNHLISILSDDYKASKNDELLNYITRKAIENSVYKNKIIKLSFDFDQNYTVNEIPPSEFTNSTFDRVFVPQQIQEELSRFYQCIKRFGEINRGLRFLFVGEPGTGKTLSTRAIINETKHQVTTILAEGQVNFSSLFTFASYFSPALICLDDLDLIFGTRSGNYNPWALGDFLSSMDGFVKNDVFLLASTNDQEFLDQAASRPGRFDAVLHYGNLNRKNYKDIIESNCKIPEIAELFSEDLLDSFKNKSITPAFLASLVKQLEIKKILNPSEDMSTYINEYIKQNFKGFYKPEIKDTVGFGFSK